MKAAQKVLAISWNRSHLHYVLGRAGRHGALQVLAAGEKSLQVPKPATDLPSKSSTGAPMQKMPEVYSSSS